MPRDLTALRERIPTEPDVGLGSSRCALPSGQDKEETQFLGYPPIGLLNARMIEPTEKKSSLYIPGLNEKLLAVRHVGILEIGKSLRHTQMCAREAVVPSEFVFVPHGPKEAQKKSSC